LSLSGTATYRGVAYMDSLPLLAGESLHVIGPQWAAFQVVPHAHVDCVQCHVGSGISPTSKGQVKAQTDDRSHLSTLAPRPSVPPSNGLRPGPQILPRKLTPPLVSSEKSCSSKPTFGDDVEDIRHPHRARPALGGVDSYRLQRQFTDTSLQQFPSTSPRQRSAGPSIAVKRAPIPTAPLRNTVSSRLERPRQRNPPHHGLHGLPQPGHPRLQTAEARRRRSHARRQPQPRACPSCTRKLCKLIQRTYASQAEAGSKDPFGLDDYYRTQYPDVWNAQRAQKSMPPRSASSPSYDRTSSPA